MNEEVKIPMWKKISYGSGAAGGNVMSTLLASYLLSYYTDTALIGADAIGTMFILSRLLDGFTNFLMGGILIKPIQNGVKHALGSFSLHHSWLLGLFLFYLSQAAGPLP